MKAGFGRTQTTKGIMCSGNKDYKLIIYDVEGIDSRERGDNKTFENCTSIFALACTDLLIINMWTIDIGRYTASNLGILNTVFKLNLKLFTQKQKKKICFVFRDFDEDQSSEKIISMMSNDIEQIWNEIPKPEKYAKAQINEFFKFEYHFFHHKIYKAKEFDEDVKNFKSLFKKSIENEHYIFEEYSAKNNIKMEIYSKYISDLWVLIKEQKELNLPSQREIIAKFKCTEYKEEAFQKLEPKIELLEKQVSIHYHESFSSDAIKIIEDCILYFKDQSSTYSKSAVEEVLKDLYKKLFDRLFRIFVIQVKHIMKNSITHLKNEIKKMASLDNPASSLWVHFEEIVSKVKSITFQYFMDSVKNNFLKNSNWEIDSSKKQFEEIVDEELKNFCDKEQIRVIDFIKKSFKNTFVQPSRDKFYSFDTNLYEIIDELYINSINGLKFILIEILIKGFKFPIPKAQELFIQIFEEIYRIGIEEIKKFDNDIPASSFRKFKQLFTRTPLNSQRNFKKMPFDEIQQIYNNQYSLIIQVINKLKFFPIFILRDTAYEKEPENAEVSISEENKKYEIFLNQKSINDIKEKFTQLAEEELDKAKQRSSSFFSKLQEIPLMFWIMFFFFGYDKILSMITNPFILAWMIPMLLIFGLIEYLGLTKFILGLAKSKLSGILSKNLKRD